MARRTRAFGLSLPVIRRAGVLHGLLTAGRGVAQSNKKCRKSTPVVGGLLHVARVRDVRICAGFGRADPSDACRL